MRRRGKQAVGNLIVLGALAAAFASHSASAQVINQAVGGVYVDADGVLAALDARSVDRLADARRRAASPIPEFLRNGSELRKVSLRGLIAELESTRPATPADVPEAIRFLGGLTRVQYVFVYPEAGDLVLAGPGEPWTFNDQGEAVGALTGAAMLQLEDLVAALEASADTGTTGVTCSIEPTAEGVERLHQLYARLGAAGAVGDDVRQAKGLLEQTAGMQTVKIGGAPYESRLAAVLAAADYRMKRIAMGFDASPVAGLPSFMKMISGKRIDQLSPRWWMTGDYAALHRDADGLAWELKGQGVKTLAEEDVVVAGERIAGKEAHPLVRRWADLMTERFEELAQEDAVFGQLRNGMDLAVISALIRREHLDERAGLSLERLATVAGPACEKYHTPTQTPSLASFYRGGRSWAVSVSGGVELDPWAIAAEQKVQTEIAAVRPEAPANQWCWD